MPLWHGKSRGTTFGYQIFVAILKNLGVGPAYFVLRFVAFYYFLFSFKSSKAIIDFFRGKMGYSRFSSIVKLYRNYYLFGQSIIDKVVVMAGISNKFSFNFDGEDNLKKMVDLQRGGLLLSAHIGNWEIAGHLLKRLNTPVNIVMFDGEHQHIKKYLAGVTGKLNVNVILIKNDISHIYEIATAFKNNELVCMHADRYMDGSKTLSTRFLGQPAHFPMGPFLLAAKFNIPVSFVYAMKEDSLHYHFFASEGKQYAYASKNAAMDEIVKDFAISMEQKVKAYPEQWYNYYNFWQQ